MFEFLRQNWNRYVLEYFIFVPIIDLKLNFEISWKKIHFWSFWLLFRAKINFLKLTFWSKWNGDVEALSISWDFISKLLGQKILSHEMTWIYVQLVLPFLVPLPSPWFPFFFFFFPPLLLLVDPFSFPLSGPEVPPPGLKGSLFPSKTSRKWSKYGTCFKIRPKKSHPSGVTLI